MPGDDIQRFPWIEPPPTAHVLAAVHRLEQLSAVLAVDPDAHRGVTAADVGSAAATQRRKVTPLGRVLSVLPVDVGVGKTLVLGAVLGYMDVVQVLAAGLSVQSPFKNKMVPGVTAGYVERSSHTSPALFSASCCSCAALAGNRRRL